MWADDTTNVVWEGQPPKLQCIFISTWLPVICQSNFSEAVRNAVSVDADVWQKSQIIPVIKLNKLVWKVDLGMIFFISWLYMIQNLIPWWHLTPLVDTLSPQRCRHTVMWLRRGKKPMWDFHRWLYRFGKKKSYQSYKKMNHMIFWEHLQEMSRSWCAIRWGCNHRNQRDKGKRETACLLATACS